MEPREAGCSPTATSAAAGVEGGGGEVKMTSESSVSTGNIVTAATSSAEAYAGLGEVDSQVAGCKRYSSPANQPLPVRLQLPPSL